MPTGSTSSDHPVSLEHSRKAKAHLSKASAHTMADPIHARELVMEDSLYSRGMLSTDQLVNEERELEQDRKGKGRAVEREEEDQDEDEEDAHSGSSSNGRYGYGHGRGDPSQHRDEREAGRRPRSRSQSQSARYDGRKDGNSYGDEDDDDDDDDDNDKDGYALSGGAGEDGDSIPLHGRRAGPRSGQRRASRDGSAITSPAGKTRRNGHASGKRARSASVLGGLLEKNTLPEDPNVSKAELRRRYLRRIAVNAVFILAWCVYTTTGFHTRRCGWPC